jgi:hypothetical protein
VLLVPYAIALVFVLDSNSALCGSNWKRRPLIADVKSLPELPSEKSVSDGHLCSWRKILVPYRQVRRRRASAWTQVLPAGALAIGGFG